ncbi:hypothetical protein C0992_008184 [Termitomyces sp. T32_za158]|nr:hypothetical protein C0992_008184 [Termitomyces sp. T32_za158]
MVSTLVALFQWKAEIDHPISHVAGEGLMKLSRRSVIMALPVVFLVYGIIAFVTGIVLYSVWGTSNDALSSQPFNDYIKWTSAAQLNLVDMWKVGGYTLSYPDAKAWASRRFPGIEFDNEVLVPYTIERHNKSLGGKNLRCMGVMLDEELVCVFVTHSEDDETATRQRFDEFEEDADVKLYKKQVFNWREFYKKAVFMTIIDPYDKGY